MADNFQGYTPKLESPPSSAAAVTPGATALASVTRAIYVGGAGNVAVTMLDGQDVTFSGVAAGTLIPIRASHVLAATTATNILALW